MANEGFQPSMAIIALTQNGVHLALRLADAYPRSELYVPRRHHFALAYGAHGFDRLRRVFGEVWGRYRVIVCIMATGIVVRLLAPLARHKSKDPAVLVMDERGRFVISLLSGHLGGANRLAEEIAGRLGATPVITTASDVDRKVALDLVAQQRSLVIQGMDRLARLQRAILEEESFWVYDPHGYLGDVRDQLNGALWAEKAEDAVNWSGRGDVAPTGLWICEREPPAGLTCVVFRPRNLVVGLGCNRGTGADEILALVEETFREQALSLRSIDKLASVDIKADEEGLLEAAWLLGVSVEWFSRAQLEQVTVPTPSEVVARHIGVRSVCEAAAILGARRGRLLVRKRKSKNVTLAVARGDWRS